MSSRKRPHPANVRNAANNEKPGSRDPGNLGSTVSRRERNRRYTPDRHTLLWTTRGCSVEFRIKFGESQKNRIQFGRRREFFADGRPKTTHIPAADLADRTMTAPSGIDVRVCTATGRTPLEPAATSEKRTASYETTPDRLHPPTLRRTVYSRNNTTPPFRRVRMWCHDLGGGHELAG